ncbi:cell division endopeptidase DipM [Caulobacter endophyticus]|uniref:Peptidase M24 n=1 Tax=Caulobacter endophyticus TaxID=2172652 RepID=A0A2T9KDS2_9CAUL|nr:LysM peptidoglycan-binding domain-containing protein [Caulobacter endophyticus]PVM94047.1 peptidase M24 [Caulobacter endophyticus]
MRQLWTQAAVIALTAGTLAACETTGAQYPTRADTGVSPPIVQAPPAAQTPPPAQPPEDDAPPVTAPVAAGAVSSQPLSPVPSDIPPPPPPPADSRPIPTPAPQQPAMRPVVVTVTGGKVVDVSGAPQTYTVQSGDGLDAIGRKMGISRVELAKLNDLEEPYRLKPGQKLKGPSTKAKAYVVESGDTLSAIARRFSVTPVALADENDMASGASIRAGQKIRLPEGYKDKGPSKTTVMQPVPGASSTLAGAAPSRPTSTASSPPIGSRPAAPPPSRPVVDDEPTPAATTTTTVSITGKVIEVAGKPKIHTVKSGDAIDSIARELGTTRKDLVEDNDLKAPYVIRPGQKLKGPATTDKAYVAESGDTLTGIAKRFNVSVSALAKENNLRTGASVKKGQKVVLPDGYKDRGPIRTTVTTPAPRPSIPAPTATAQAPIGASPAPAPSTSGLPSSPRPYTPSGSSSSYPRPSAPVSAQPITPPPAPSRPIIESSAPPTEAEITAAGRGRFIWPVRGETISDFGPKGTGQRNDGLNIRASAGAPVKAAASGEVVYAGNQVPGFGNLVLVKHADGWVTAYAHLAATDVKMRQQVGQGEQLGTVGQTGGVNEPQLHFEVRYAPTPKDKAKPIDPGLVLPR